MEPGDAAGTALNPWAIFWQPQATIKAIVSRDARQYVLLLAAVAGTYAAVRCLPLLPWFTMVVMVLLIGPLFGILMLYVNGALTAWTGRLLGGRASQLTLRAAIAWSSIPLVIALPVLVGSSAASAPILPLLYLWGLFLSVRTIGAVQGFGVIRSIVNVLIPLYVFRAAALLIGAVLFQSFHLPSASMQPSLFDGDYFFVSKLSYGYSRYSFYGLIPFSGRIFPAEPKRGDIVVFRLPRDNSTDYTKRVIGLPGDAIIVSGGVLFINGKEVPRRRIGNLVAQADAGPPRPVPAYEETLPNGVKYTVLDAEPNGPFDNVGPYKVPEGHYFMMGDNRDNSTDSRASWDVGYVPFENLIGRVSSIFHLGYSTPPTSAAQFLSRRRVPVAPGIVEAAQMPAPVLQFDGTEEYQAHSQQWIRYKLSVINWSSYEAGLFTPAPNLPPCGRNTSSSRTWVNIFSGQGSRLYGFCGLGSPNDLGKLWFAVKKHESPPCPSLVFITITDRLTENQVTSNRVSIPPLAARAEEAHTVPSPLNGLWLNENTGHRMTIETKPGGRLIIKEARPDDLNAEIGDVVGEARPLHRNEWVGRHTWGGCKTGDLKWGVEGGLYMSLVSKDEFFVQYRDSKYTGGWTFRRAPPARPRAGWRV